MISLELYVKGNIDRRKIRNDLKILLEKLDAKEKYMKGDKKE